MSTMASACIEANPKSKHQTEKACPDLIRAWSRSSHEIMRERKPGTG
jgi:hypothetical protein